MRGWYISGSGVADGVLRVRSGRILRGRCCDQHAVSSGPVWQSHWTDSVRGVPQVPAWQLLPAGLDRAHGMHGGHVFIVMGLEPVCRLCSGVIPGQNGSAGLQAVRAWRILHGGSGGHDALPQGHVQQLHWDGVTGKLQHRTCGHDVCSGCHHPCAMLARLVLRCCGSGGVPVPRMRGWYVPGSGGPDIMLAM